MKVERKALAEVNGRGKGGLASGLYLASLLPASHKPANQPVSLIQIPILPVSKPTCL